MAKKCPVTGEIGDACPGEQAQYKDITEIPEWALSEWVQRSVAAASVASPQPTGTAESVPRGHTPTEGDTSLREFTLEELRECDGVDGAPLYVALSGKVHDVSKGAQHYGPGGPYHIFAGRDASRALAKGSLDESELRDEYDDLEDLTEEEKECLKGWCGMYEKYPVVGYLMGANFLAREDNIFSAASAGKADLLRRLLEEGADVHAMNDFDFTALHLAAKNGAVDCAIVLLDAGANIDQLNLATKETPLMLACTAGNVDVARVLVERGADFHKQDGMGCTPLITACAGGYADVAKMLLDAGAAKALADREGWQPLHWAAAKGHVDCIELLLEVGADINATEMHGNTSVHWAGKMGQPEAFDMLVQRGADMQKTNNKGELPALQSAPVDSGTCTVQ